LSERISDYNSLDLVELEPDFVDGTIVKPGGLRAGVVGDLPDVLDASAVLAEGGDAGRPKRVIADVRTVNVSPLSRRALGFETPREFVAAG
jgi:hypothetical protein